MTDLTMTHARLLRWRDRAWRWYGVPILGAFADWRARVWERKRDALL